MTSLSFAPSEERLALLDSATRVLRDRYEVNQERHFEAARWREFAELGWLAAGLGDSSGGLGLPWSTVSVVAETLAPAAAIEPLAAQLALTGYVLDCAKPGVLRNEALDAWLTGETLFALAHEEQDRAPWSSDSLLTRCRREGNHYVLSGRKALVLDGGLAQRVLVSAQDEQAQLALFIFDSSAAGLTFEMRDSIDGRAHRQLTLHDAHISAASRLDFAHDGAEVLAASAWLHALLLSAESVGVLRAMLRASHQYLVQRTQFDRALIEFQVLQHRLVDMLLTLTRLESLLEIARYRCDELGPLAAAPYIAAAKSACGEEGRVLARQAVQLHGAIGLTAELALGRQLRRLTALEMLAGTCAEHHQYWSSHRTSIDVV